MSESYIGEIRMFAGNFAPAGWALCDGSLLTISENDTLFQLIGTTYGGDGQTNFAVPDLRGRVPVHISTGYVIGQTGGAVEKTLTSAQMPSHTHAATFNNLGSGPKAATTPASSNTAVAGSLPAKATTSAPGGTAPLIYVPAGSATGQVSLDGLGAVTGTVTVGSAGGNQPFSVMQPYLGMNFIISLFGIFPSPT